MRNCTHLIQTLSGLFSLTKEFDDMFHSLDDAEAAFHIYKLEHRDILSWL